MLHKHPPKQIYLSTLPLPYPTLPYPTLPYLSCKEQRMISEIFILFFKASLTIRHTTTVSQKKSGTSKKIQWDFQISRVGSLDFLDLKVNGSPEVGRPSVVNKQNKWVSNSKAGHKSRSLVNVGGFFLQTGRLDIHFRPY